MLTRSFSSALALFSSFVALALTSLTSLHAQTDSTLPNGPALGATVDRFIHEGQGITAVSFRFSRMPSRPARSIWPPIWDPPSTSPARVSPCC
jgi:hypothetical protein